MVNLRFVCGRWSSMNLCRCRLSLAASTTHLRTYTTTRVWSQFTGKNLYTRDELDRIWAWGGSNSLDTQWERSFATTNLHLAKSKDRGKDRRKATHVQVNLNELSEIINVEKLTVQMESAVNELKTNYAKNLTLRSSIGSIEQLPVAWEGKEYQLQELSQIVRKPKMLVINVSAFPQVIPSILQAVAKSGMNLNPQQDGTSLFVPIPKVTKEHRENLAKSAKAMFIGCRDDIKDVQLRCVKSLKNKTDVSKDVIHNTQSQLQTLTDKFVAEAEGIFKMKQKELLGDTD